LPANVSKGSMVLTNGKQYAQLTTFYNRQTKSILREEFDPGYKEMLAIICLT